MSTTTPGSRRFFVANPSIVSNDWLEWEIVDCTTYERVCTTNTEKTAREIVAALEYFHANIRRSDTERLNSGTILLSVCGERVHYVAQDLRAAIDAGIAANAGDVARPGDGATSKPEQKLRFQADN